ncbi:MAG: hypothetical protein K0U74_15665 [Alphaproteobacteria bacterium]|nr:hypothetical protein [Alphaproteobacteria bacterium]
MLDPKPFATLLLIGIAAMASAPSHANEPLPQLIGKPRPATAPHRPIEISPQLAARVGHQVWLNETGGNHDAITAWNASEDFASLGIGHFIWFSEGLKSRFQESFPQMLSFLRARGAKPPAWLDKSPVPSSPWHTKRQFQRAFNSARMKGLRRFLHQTKGLQAQFLALRMNEALPKLLASLPSARQRTHVRRQFERVTAASKDLYPLIDYINFKGEGISPKETFPNRKTGRPEGWGLKSVLLAMNGTSKEPRAVLAEFADAARFALLRRIANNPRDKRWQKGWMARVETYRHPLR